MTRKRNKIRKAKKDTYTFVVDGKNEYWYFQMLKRNEPDLQINIEPKFPQKKELSEQYEKVIELAADFTKVFLDYRFRRHHQRVKRNRKREKNTRSKT